MAVLGLGLSSYRQICQETDIPEAHPRVSAYCQAEGSTPYTAALRQPIIAILMIKKYTAESTLLNYVILFVKLHQKI